MPVKINFVFRSAFSKMFVKFLELLLRKVDLIRKIFKDSISGCYIFYLEMIPKNFLISETKKFHDYGSICFRLFSTQTMSPFNFSPNNSHFFLCKASNNAFGNPTSRFPVLPVLLILNCFASFCSPCRQQHCSFQSDDHKRISSRT